MDRQRPRTSRPRRRPEPLMAKHLPEQLYSGTARGADTSKVVRPQTASLKPSRSRPSSGVRDEQRLQHARGSSGTETKAFSPKLSSSRTSLRRSSSGMHPVQEKEKHYSNLSSSGTETDTETLRPISPNRYESNPAEPVTYTNALKDYEAERAYSSDFESEDDAATVISVVSGSKYSPPSPPMDDSDVPPIEIQYSSPEDSDGAETVMSPTPRKQRSTRGVRSQIYLQDEAAELEKPNSNDAGTNSKNKRSVSGVGSRICLNVEETNLPMFDLEDEKKVVPLDPPRKTRNPSSIRSQRSSREEDRPKEQSLNVEDAENVVPMDTRKRRTPSGSRSQICLRDEAPKVPMLVLDDADPKKKRSPSGVRSKISLREDASKKPIANMHDTRRSVPSVPPQQGRRDVVPKLPMISSGGSKSHLSMAQRKKESSCGVRSRALETPKVPMLDLDDLKSVSGQSVLLKSAHACTDLKQDPKRRGSSVSRLKEQLQNITLKNMLFFPSKNLTRPSIEEIYGPAKKRSQSLRRGGNNSVDKAKMQKKPYELDTSRPAADKEAEKTCEPIAKKNEPKILAPLLGRTRLDKKTDRNRPTGPVKPKPFHPAGCGKGIPSLDKLPKPRIGVIPSFLLNRKKEAGNMKSASLSVLENKDLKPAIPSAASSNKNKPEPPKTTKQINVKNSRSTTTTNNGKTTDSLFIRNRIPLRKPGTNSTSNLISNISKPKKSAVELKSKKSVSFDIPAEPKVQPTEDQEEIEEEPEEKLPNSTYRDPCKQSFKGVMEKAPIFDDGPLPITEPSQIYLNIQKLGWDYSRFTPKNYKPPKPMIPYDFLDQYLHVFDNNLERAAVHTKYGSVTDCTCQQASTSSDFCEKHIDAPKLQYYQEVSEVMIALLSFRYEIPEYEKAEKMFEEFYPCIYECWVVKLYLRLSMDYRVREARCKSELVKSCVRVLEEEELLAEFLQCEEDIGSRRDISISGRMKDIDDDFELSYTFLFKEYPHLFIYLVKNIEFIPLALERKIVSTFRKQIVAKANLPEEKLQEEEESYRKKLERKIEVEE